MRKVVEYFGQTDTYVTDILSTTMKEYPKVISRMVKFNTGDADIDNMLLVKQLLAWVYRTSNLSANMFQAYNVILGQSTTFTSSKLKSLKGWEAMSESLDLIA